MALFEQDQTWTRTLPVLELTFIEQLPILLCGPATVSHQSSTLAAMPSTSECRSSVMLYIAGEKKSIHEP